VPRFYFPLINDDDVPDDEGKELRDLEAAREFARRSAIFSAAESIKDKAHLVRSHYIQIEDADGNVLDAIRFGDVVTVED
jgi:hypothetical protein